MPTLQSFLESRGRRLYVATFVPWALLDRNGSLIGF